MNKYIIICLVFGAVLCLAMEERKKFYDLEKADEVFEEFIVNFGKDYKDEDEKQSRFEIFKETLNTINNHNKGNHSYALGLYQFADMTTKEINECLGVRRQ